MKCPYCGNQDDRVIDTRCPEGGEVTRRRRECTGCNRRYTTIERVEIALPVVVKADGRREPFNRDKILRGLRLACAKRPVSEDDLNRVADEVERSSAARGQAEIPGHDVGALVMQYLRDLDDIAYIRFASVYRRFEDVDSLLAEAQDVKATARPTDPNLSLELPLNLE